MNAETNRVYGIDKSNVAFLVNDTSDDHGCLRC